MSQGKYKPENLRKARERFKRQRMENLERKRQKVAERMNQNQEAADHVATLDEVQGALHHGPLDSGPDNVVGGDPTNPPDMVSLDPGQVDGSETGKLIPPPPPPPTPPGEKDVFDKFLDTPEGVGVVLTPEEEADLAEFFGVTFQITVNNVILKKHGDELINDDEASRWGKAFQKVFKKHYKGGLSAEAKLGIITVSIVATKVAWQSFGKKEKKGSEKNGRKFTGCSSTEAEGTLPGESLPQLS